MEAYFDNSATTKVSEAVKDIVVKVMVEDIWKSIVNAHGWR